MLSSRGRPSSLWQLKDLGKVLLLLLLLLCFWTISVVMLFTHALSGQSDWPSTLVCVDWRLGVLSWLWSLLSPVKYEVIIYFQVYKLWRLYRGDAYGLNGVGKCKISYPQSSPLHFSVSNSILYLTYLFVCLILFWNWCWDGVIYHDCFILCLIKSLFSEMSGSWLKMLPYPGWGPCQWHHWLPCYDVFCVMEKQVPPYDTVRTYRKLHKGLCMEKDFTE